MVFEFWIFGWLYSGSSDLWISEHQELYFCVPQVPRLDNTTNIYIYTPHISIYTYVHERTPLAKPGFCSGGRISCKPNHGALLSNSINKNDDSKSPDYCALLGTRTTSNNGSKRTGAGMDIPALLLPAINSNIHNRISYRCDNDSNNGTTYNNMNKSNNTSNRNKNSTRNSSIIAIIMMVILKVPVKAIVLHLILVKRRKVVIVVLAALILVLERTTIVCSNQLILIPTTTAVIIVVVITTTTATSNASI